ncbi:MAG: ABC transporter ATP-binding protein [Bryobacteraceae bacterium]|nr:ABC transporter ATP-binding protein [Bryobacteraceae bacterium]
MASIVTEAVSSAQSTARIKVAQVSVKYLLMTEQQRTLAGRVVGWARRAADRADFWALRDVSLQVDPGEVVGIIGRNGSGKSTLLRVIAGIISPTIGTVSISGRVSPLLELGAAFSGELTGRENAYLYGSLLRIPKAKMDSLMPEIAAFADIGPFFDAPLKTYSSGMVARVAFAVSTQVQPEILLIDEILSVGDADFQRKSYFRMKKLISKGTIVIIVSHTTATVEQLCSRAVYLNQGQVVADGKPREVILRYNLDAS